MYTYAFSNSDAVQRICEVYVTQGQLVLDCTYGKGNWWKWPHSGKLQLVASDLYPQQQGTLRATYHALPFKDAMFDAAFFDPPYYGHGSKTRGEPTASKQTGSFYGNRQEPTRNAFLRGLVELSRVVKDKGIIVTKVTDGCDYYPMVPWVVGLRIGKFVDSVILVNQALRNWTPNKTARRKLRTCHSTFVVLRNHHYGRGAP